MAEKIQSPRRVLRRREVESRVGLKRTAIYDAIRAGSFPKPVRIGSRAVAWVESEIDTWLAAQVERSRKSG